MAVLAIAYVIASFFGMIGYSLGVLITKNIFGGFFGWILGTLIGIPAVILTFNLLVGVWV